MLLALAGYLAFFAAGIVLPGVALQRLLRLPVDTALVLPLGTAFAAGTYWFSLVMQAAWLFPAALVVVAVAALRSPQPWRRAAGPGLKEAWLPLLGVVVFFTLTQYPWNRPAPSGDFMLDPLVTHDTTFHVGLTRELTLGYPPQVPGLAGFPLGYHFGTDLVRAAALRWARVDPFDSISRFDLTTGALALILLLRATAQRLALPPLAVTLAPWTLLLGDLAFLFGTNPQAHWWSDLLRGNLLVSLALANPAVPALALLLGSLLALARGLAREGRPWLVLAALQAGALPYFKVFLGAHLLLGLGVLWLLRPPARIATLVTALPCALATALLALGQGGTSVAVSLAPLDLAQATRKGLLLEPVEGVALAAWGALWLAASLGLRVLGLWPALRALATGPPQACALAAMALAGWPLGLLFRIAPPVFLAGESPHNDSAYFIEQSGPLLWIFTIGALATFARSPARQVLAGLAVAALALPTTLQFGIKKSRLPPDLVPAAMLRAARVVESATRPGEVVLQRPAGRYPPTPLIFAGRRVPYERFTPYLTQFAAPRAIRARHALLARFFRTRDAGQALEIAERLGASVVCLYGPDRLRFPTEGRVEWLHREPGARVLRLNVGHHPERR